MDQELFWGYWLFMVSICYFQVNYDCLGITSCYLVFFQLHDLYNFTEIRQYCFIPEITCNGDMQEQFGMCHIYITLHPFVRVKRFLKM